MSLATAELPTDPDDLRAFALACQSELKVADLSVQVKALAIETLKFQIAKLRRMQSASAATSMSPTPRARRARPGTGSARAGAHASCRRARYGIARIPDRRRRVRPRTGDERALVPCRERRRRLGAHADQVLCQALDD
jgi:hypothetical protein